MSKQNIVPMAQGYMKLECIPDHVGAHWAALIEITSEDGSLIWKDIISGSEFTPDENQVLWTDVDTQNVYESVHTTPYWFDRADSSIYVPAPEQEQEDEDQDMLPVPFYEWPDIEDLPESCRAKLYWNHYSLSGISDPYLIRFVHLKEGQSIEEAEEKNLIGVWGTNSYRTVRTPEDNEYYDEHEIP